MKPYYDEGGITIYHGDCREVLPSLAKSDLVLTDPPYGIADVWKGGAGHGWGKSRAQGTLRNDWDQFPPDSDTLEMVISKGTTVIIWGGNYFTLPVSRGWLVWNKPERGFSLGEAELAWTNMDTVIRVGDFKRSDKYRDHPTQKPVGLMAWCIRQAPKDITTVVDPYMGSGTTLVSSKSMGLRCIGIEVNEQYCEIAARRLAQGVLFGGSDSFSG